MKLSRRHGAYSEVESLKKGKWQIAKDYRFLEMALAVLIALCIMAVFCNTLWSGEIFFESITSYFKILKAEYFPEKVTMSEMIEIEKLKKSDFNYVVFYPTMLYCLFYFFLYTTKKANSRIIRFIQVRDNVKFFDYLFFRFSYPKIFGKGENDGLKQFLYAFPYIFYKNLFSTAIDYLRFIINAPFLLLSFLMFFPEDWKKVLKIDFGYLDKLERKFFFQIAQKDDGYERAKELTIFKDRKILFGNNYEDIKNLFKSSDDFDDLFYIIEGYLHNSKLFDTKLYKLDEDITAPIDYYFTNYKNLNKLNIELRAKKEINYDDEYNKIKLELDNELKMIKDSNKSKNTLSYIQDAGFGSSDKQTLVTKSEQVIKNEYKNKIAKLNEKLEKLMLKLIITEIIANDNSIEKKQSVIEKKLKDENQYKYFQSYMLRKKASKDDKNTTVLTDDVTLSLMSFNVFLSDKKEKFSKYISDIFNVSENGVSSPSKEFIARLDKLYCDLHFNKKLKKCSTAEEMFACNLALENTNISKKMIKAGDFVRTKGNSTRSIINYYLEYSFKAKQEKEQISIIKSVKNISSAKINKLIAVTKNKIAQDNISEVNKVKFTKELDAYENVKKILSENENSILKNDESLKNLFDFAIKLGYILIRDKIRNMLLADFSFVIFRMMISQFMNIPAGTIVSKIDSYDTRMIIEYYKTRATIEIEEKRNDGQSEAYQSDNYVNLFLILFNTFVDNPKNKVYQELYFKFNTSEATKPMTFEELKNSIDSLGIDEVSESYNLNVQTINEVKKFGY